MLGINVFLGDMLGTGRSLLQVPDGALPKLAVSRFLKLTADPGPFRNAVSRYAQANMLQLMQGTHATRSTISNNAAAAGCCRPTIRSAAMSFF
jgi:hypothetical protein